MNRAKTMLISGILALTLAGCSAAVRGTGNVSASASTPAPPTTQAEGEVTVMVQPEDSIPTETDVLAAREQALEGMSPDQIERLTETIKAANLCLEKGYLFNDLFGKLEDPDSLYWNYFHQTGEIQIGWAVEGGLDIASICEQENLTEQEFYTKYGKAVVANNRYDADAFISLLQELIADVQNENLDAELQSIIDETEQAKETHIVEHVNHLYKKLHDLDYFLLRYGPADVGPYVKDDSIISKYYGTLSIYTTQHDGNG